MSDPLEWKPLLKCRKLNERPGAPSDNYSIVKNLTFRLMKTTKLPITYCLPKMHKTSNGSRLMLLLRLLLIYHYLILFQKYLKQSIYSCMYLQVFIKSRFYSSFQKFWVVQNSFSLINTLNKINLVVANWNYTKFLKRFIILCPPDCRFINDRCEANNNAEFF